MNEFQKTPEKRLSFASDYMEGAHPKILSRMQEINFSHMPGYGTDEICQTAAEKIRAACRSPHSGVYFLTGGTQTNALIIRTLLQPWEGVIAPDTGHISTHEAGAIEFGGHKVMTLPGHNGKLDADELSSYLDTCFSDGNKEHMVLPGMVYVSHPTENGTLYSQKELAALREVCDRFSLKLYLDGARLAYALACPQNDLQLDDLARLTDVFYIGGTKCGAFFGEAVVMRSPDLIPHFFTLIKQQGALLAKGWLLGLQFDTLFTDDLYLHIGENAIRCAGLLRSAFTEKGYRMYFDTPTNQIFIVLDQKQYDALSACADFSFWEKVDAEHTAVRFATSWATREEDVRALTAYL